MAAKLSLGNLQKLITGESNDASWYGLAGLDTNDVKSSKNHQRSG